MNQVLHIDSRQTSKPTVFRTRQTWLWSPSSINQPCIHVSQHKASLDQKTLQPPFPGWEETMQEGCLYKDYIIWTTKKTNKKKNNLRQVQKQLPGKSWRPFKEEGSFTPQPEPSALMLFPPQCLSKVPQPPHTIPVRNSQEVSHRLAATSTMHSTRNHTAHWNSMLKAVPTRTYWEAEKHKLPSLCSQDTFYNTMVYNAGTSSRFLQQ